MAASASDAHPFPIYNARFRMVFPLLDADGDLVTGAAGLDTELSQDCGTAADATNEATEIATSSGMYYLDLIATELDTQSTSGIVKTTTTGGKTTPFVLYPKRLPVIRTGTAQAGAASTITLDSGASAIDNYYAGCYVNITNNTPTNALGQARKIVSYVGSTKVATVEGTYGTNPSSSSTFEVLATEDWTFRFADDRAWIGTVLPAPATAGIPDVNAKNWNNLATVELPLVPTVAGRKLDVSAGGEAGVDWANVGSPTTTVGLSGTTVKTATDVEAKVPTALVGGRMDSNVGSVNSSTTGVDKLSAHLPSVLMAVLTSGSSTTAVVLNATTGINGGVPSAVDDFYRDSVIIFTSGALAGQRRLITGYVGATKTLTVLALTGSPASGVTAVIV